MFCILTRAPRYISRACLVFSHSRAVIKQWSSWSRHCRTKIARQYLRDSSTNRRKSTSTNRYAVHKGTRHRKTKSFFFSFPSFRSFSFSFLLFLASFLFFFFFQTLKNIPKLVSCLFRNGFPAPVPVKSLLCHVPSICRVFRGNSGFIVPSTFLCSLYAAKMEERARADSMYRASIGTTKGNDRERTDWEEWNRGFRFESAPFPPHLFQNCAFCSPRVVCPVTIF